MCHRVLRDIAKNVFQVHGIDANETVVVRKRLRRSQVLAFFKALPPCLIGMEACATAHYWARELLMRQRTQSINALRAHLAELGIVAAQGDKGVKELLSIVADEKDARLPIDARASVIVLAAQLQAVQTLIGSIEKRIKTQHRSNEASKRLETIPGIGVIGASAIAATVADPTVFRSGRNFAAWIGLVPRQDSTGGKQKLGPISKQGDRYLRRILVVGAHSVLRRAKQNPEKYFWLTQLLARRPFKVVAVALANKMARMAWALLAHGGTYRAPVLAAAA